MSLRVVMKRRKKTGEKCLTRVLNMSMFAQHRARTVLRGLQQKILYIRRRNNVMEIYYGLCIKS